VRFFINFFRMRRNCSREEADLNRQRQERLPALYEISAGVSLGKSRFRRIEMRPGEGMVVNRRGRARLCKRLG
jgi:hypothetical protein